MNECFRSERRQRQRHGLVKIDIQNFLDISWAGPGTFQKRPWAGQYIKSFSCQISERRHLMSNPFVFLLCCAAQRRQLEPGARRKAVYSEECCVVKRVYTLTKSFKSLNAIKLYSSFRRFYKVSSC